MIAASQPATSLGMTHKVLLTVLLTIGIAMTISILANTFVKVVEDIMDAESGYNQHWPRRDGCGNSMVVEDIDGLFWWVGAERVSVHRTPGGETPVTGDIRLALLPHWKSPTPTPTLQCTTPTDTDLVTQVTVWRRNKDVYSFLHSRGVAINGVPIHGTSSSWHPWWRYTDHPRRDQWLRCGANQDCNQTKT